MSDKRKGNMIRYIHICFEIRLFRHGFTQEMKKMTKEMSRQTAQDRLHCQTSQPTQYTGALGALLGYRIFSKLLPLRN